MSEPQQKTEEWEVELGRLTFKAYKEGLWHSESSLKESLKSFISHILSQSNKNTLEEAIERINKLLVIQSADEEYEEISEDLIQKKEVLSTLQELKGKK